MERDFYTDEFEDLVKLKADQYRMYPSDRVWKGIKRSLHSNRRKYWFGFALLLTGLSYFGIDQLIVSPPVKEVTNPAAPEQASPENQQARIVPFAQVTPDQVRTAEAGIATGQSPKPAVIRELPVVTPAEIPATFAQRSPLAGEPNSIDITSETGELTLESKQLPLIGLDNPRVMVAGPVLISGQEKNQQEQDNSNINWLQEYAVYDLSPSRPKRLSWQMSFAPTMSYRRMIGRNNANIQSSARNIPIALSIEGDVDRLVNHKPALGFELGSFVVYAVNQNLALKGGLQFNYSRYEIQAYSSATERATISLNSINGLSNSSISNLTQLRNFGGYAVQELQNQYFQVSVPMGIELTLLGSNKLQLGVAGTVQPTYLLNRNNYLISSDYKNYTKEPSLLRKWNVHTSAEAFVSYKTAGLKWQVGPQVRYQLFSSYTDKYPIKEYLIEYGVKIGVTKTIR